VRATRRAREPWQRSDETLDRLLDSGTLVGLVTAEGAAVIRPSGTQGSVEQLAAADADAAAELVAGALARWRPLRFSNVPAAHEAARALARFAGEPRLRQHELRLDLR